MTYTIHPDAMFDPGKPILGSTQAEARDNLIASFAGEPDAPKLSVLALEPLVAGGVIRYSEISSVPSAITDRAFVPMLQAGTVRCVIGNAGGAGGVASTVVKRRRGASGSETTLATGGAALTADISVEPGDVIIMGAGSSGSNSNVVFELRTGGQNIWPGLQFLIVS